MTVDRGDREVQEVAERLPDTGSQYGCTWSRNDDDTYAVTCTMAGDPQETVSGNWSRQNVARTLWARAGTAKLLMSTGVCSRHKFRDPDCKACSTEPEDIFPDWEEKLAEAEAAGEVTCTACRFIYYAVVDRCPLCSALRE
jgi:hypothetical protein